MLKDPKESRIRILEQTQATCRIHLEDWARKAEDLNAIVPLAKSPRERTSMNIVLDDQRKVMKALTRLQTDVSELLDSR
jgi:hypothetical protein